ncbi:hypothetical protein C0J52_27214 [Blattella germanica]|nr:hypothetical protein C0J52_27214 [Blattella germanica]
MSVICSTRNKCLEDAFSLGLTDGYAAHSDSPLHHVEDFIYNKAQFIEIEDIVFCGPSRKFTLADVYWSGVVKGFKLHYVPVEILVKTVIEDFESVCVDMFANLEMGAGHSFSCPEHINRKGADPFMTFSTSCCTETNEQPSQETAGKMRSDSECSESTNSSNTSRRAERFLNYLRDSFDQTQSGGKYDNLMKSLQDMGPTGRSKISKNLASKLQFYVKKLLFSGHYEPRKCTGIKLETQGRSCCDWAGKLNDLIEHVIVNHPIRAMTLVKDCRASLKLPKLRKLETHLEIFRYDGHIFIMTARIEKFFTYMLLQHIGPLDLSNKFRYGITVKTTDGEQTVTEYAFTTSYTECAEDFFEKIKSITFFMSFITLCFNAQHELPYELTINMP